MFKIKALLLFLYLTLKSLFWFSYKIRGNIFKTLSWINECFKALNTLVQVRQKWMIGWFCFYMMVKTSTVSASNYIKCYLKS
jgi:hypothetical protein